MMKLYKQLAMVPVLASLSLGSTALLADEPGDSGDELDITMTVVEEDADPDAIIQLIELPLSASEQGATSSEPGLETANRARELGREFGASVAAEARASAEVIRDTATGLSSEASGTLRETVKDNITAGDLRDVPSEVTDNLPDLPVNTNDLPVDGGDVPLNP